MRFFKERSTGNSSRRAFSRHGISVAAIAFALVVLSTTIAYMAGAPLPGAIFTTDAGCTGVDLNIYQSKDAVYVDGGPAHPGAAGLPDGSYYIQVTTPDGNVLGTSVGSGNETPITVVAGEFQSCYQLSAILITAGDICTPGNPGYCTTDNPGGEYKVWVSTVSTFDNNSSKTDNFKVQENPFPPQGLLKVLKFYDGNANGIFDATDTPITGWETHVGLQATFDTIFETKDTPVSIVVLAPSCYTAQEGEIADANHTWVHTNASIQSKSVPVPGTAEIDFGNVCLGGGGGLTLGFWSNKNGQALVSTNTGNVSVCGAALPASDLAWLVGLNLRDGAGNNFDPASYTAFRTWLLSANATNMAYMLSAQLSAMELNVLNGKVNGSAIVYAPGTGGSDFKSVCTLMGLANTELGLHGSVLSGSPYRAYQEALKNALDRANNDQNFVQGSAGQCGVVNDSIDSNLSFTYPASFSIPACP
jgi:hypothetical protein